MMMLSSPVSRGSITTVGRWNKHEEVQETQRCGTTEARATKRSEVKMNQEGRITTERRGHVLLIGLDRVAKRNAFDRAMLNALGLAYGELERDDDLRCGVLFAHGDHFTGGLELTQFSSSLGHFEYGEGALDPLGIRGPRLTKPMIVAVQGICLTIGIELM